MKHVKLFEQFETELNETAEFPRGTQYKISAQFLPENDDDRINFIETYGLEDEDTNWVQAYVDKKTLKKMVKDLKDVYGLKGAAVTIKLKGGGAWDIYTLDKLPKGI